jgi:hypothetical protein
MSINYNMLAFSLAACGLPARQAMQLDAEKTAYRETFPTDR